MSNFNNIFDNKIKYKKQVDINLSITTGYTINYDNYIDRRDQSNEFDVPWDLLRLTIAIDDVVLYQGTVDLNGVQLHHVIIDTDQSQQHRITFTVDGFTSQHSFIHQDQEINAQILIDQFEIANLDIREVVSVYGIRTLDNQPGSNFTAHEMLHGDGTLSLEFDTPIYPWLLSNFSNILHSKSR